MMTTARIEGIDSTHAHPRRPHADAGIVFGSAASSPARKPDSVRATCEAIGLARSTYYYQSHRSAVAIEFEQKIVLRLHELKKLRPSDGYRRMTQQLQAEGFHVNRKRIARLMALHGLSRRAASPGPTFNLQPRVQVATNSLSLATQARDTGSRDLSRLTGPHQVWITDVSYAHIRASLVYTAAVIDAWSREIVGYAAALQITNRLARIALHSAVRAHRPAPGCIHHSTCGAQYLTRSYRELLRQYGLIPSTPENMSERVTSCIRLPSNQAAMEPHDIVDLQEYDSWHDVISRPRQFIEALYSPSRLDTLFGHNSASVFGRQ